MKLIITTLKYVCLLMLFALLLTGCKDRRTLEPSASSLKVRASTVLLLDLSDRLLQQGQAVRDTTIIMNAYDAFVAKVRPMAIASVDKFKVICDSARCK